jgi:microcompartment protein CcmK/EutM
MQMAQVVGTVVATQKHRKLEGAKLLLVQPLTLDDQPRGTTLLAIDAVGAGVGEVVLYASGSSARQTRVTRDRPVDATIMAIVDSIEHEGRQTYTK